MRTLFLFFGMGGWQSVGAPGPPSGGRLVDTIACHLQQPWGQSYPFHLLRVEADRLAPWLTLPDLETRRAGVHLPLLISEPTSFPRWKACAALSPQRGRKITKELWSVNDWPPFEEAHVMERSHACRELPSGMWDVPSPARFLFDQIRDPFITRSAWSCKHRGQASQNLPFPRSILG